MSCDTKYKPNNVNISQWKGMWSFCTAMCVHSPAVGLPVLLSAEEEAVLCGSAILAAAASGLKVNQPLNPLIDRDKRGGEGFGK